MFITPDQKPIFAGTYFQREVFQELLKQINILWQTNRDQITSFEFDYERLPDVDYSEMYEPSGRELIERAYTELKCLFDEKHGGFGYAPKFPMPHNIIFIMDYFQKSGEQEALSMAEITLIQMYKGGIFDHVGGGFSRYSTDSYFLVPHFEKMLYDNALLIMSYTKAYTITKKEIYKKIAKKTAQFIMREMMNKDGGFYSAQDADSDREEGKYYVFDYDEIITLLGERTGKAFNKYYGASREGNFEGKNILNLLNNPETEELEDYLYKLYEYRKTRTNLSLDDKILTSQNGLMIAALSELYKADGDEKYLNAAESAYDFIEKKLSDGDSLYVSCRNGKKGVLGFIDDYAFYVFGLIKLYDATYNNIYLERAKKLCKKTVTDFFDSESGGFYLYGVNSEKLIIKPKEV